MSQQVFSGTAHTISGEIRTYENQGIKGTSSEETKYYEDVKPDFDKICWRIDDILAYFYVDTSGEVQKYDLPKLKERTKEIQVMEVVGSRGDEPITKKKAFIDLWEIDADKKKYRTMGLYPKNCPKDVYNLWKGFDIEKLGKECKDDGDIKPFRDLLLALVGGKIEDREYVEKWLAHLFQFPEKQTPIALVFQGTGGEGKSKFWKFIGELMGVNTFCSTDEPEKDIFEKHSTLLEGKKLAVFEEMEQATHKKRMRQLRNMIDGNGLLSFRPLNCPAYSVQNLVSFVFTSNDKVPVVMYGHNNKRRFVLFQAEGTYRNGTKSAIDPKGQAPKDFWKKWLSWETKVENKKAVFNHLMGLETSLDFLYDPDYKPQTQYHKEVIRKCLPLEVKWLDKFITEEFPKECYTENDGAETDTREVVVSTNFLRNNFIADHSFTNQISSCAFGIKLKELVMKDGLPFDNKCEAGKPLRTKIQNIAAWRFKRKDVYDWLVEKDYTDFKIEGHSLPPPVGCVENSGFKK